MKSVRIGGSAASNKLRINGKSVLKLVKDGLTLWVNPGEPANVIAVRAAASALARPPAILRGHKLSVPRATVTSLARGVAVTAGIGVAVGVPRALVSTGALAPGASAAARVGVPVAAVTAQAPQGIQAGGGRVVDVPVATVSTQASGMGVVVVAGRSVAVGSPRALATAEAKAPAVQQGTFLGVPVATVSADAKPALPSTFQGGGMTKSGTQLAAGTGWENVVGWVVRSGFPDTIIESDGIRVPAGVAINWKYDVNLSTTPLDKAESTRLMDGETPVTGSTYGHGNYQDPPMRSGTYVGTGDIIRLQVSLEGTTARRTVTATSYIEITKV